MLTLVLMAAGLGTRFGGLKQLAPVGPHGEALMDYAVYDAARAGFKRLVMIVRSEIAGQVQRHAERYEGTIEVEYCLQDSDGLVPPRPKPWGTCHAVVAAGPLIGTPFAVLNADDFYGRSSLELLGEALAEPGGTHCLVAYPLRTVLSSHDAVMRGICRLGPGGNLASVDETRVPTDPTQAGLTGDEPVSMNAWGFRPSILEPLRRTLEGFVAARADDPDAELQLPQVVNDLLRDPSPPVFRVLRARDRWIGITHAEDLDPARAELATLANEGVYPSPLWRA